MSFIPINLLVVCKLISHRQVRSCYSTYVCGEIWFMLCLYWNIKLPAKKKGMWAWLCSEEEELYWSGALCPLTAEGLVPAHTSESLESSCVWCFPFLARGTQRHPVVRDGVRWVFCPCRGRVWAHLAGNWWGLCVCAAQLGSALLCPVAGVAVLISALPAVLCIQCNYYSPLPGGEIPQEMSMTS